MSDIREAHAPDLLLADKVEAEIDRCVIIITALEEQTKHYRDWLKTLLSADWSRA